MYNYLYIYTTITVIIYHTNYHPYYYYKNGDLNWCMEGRFVAFAGPHDERKCSPGGYYNLRPEDYIP